MIFDVVLNAVDTKLTEPSINIPSTTTATLRVKFFMPDTKNKFPNLFRYKTLKERSLIKLIGYSSLNFCKSIRLCNSIPKNRNAIIKPEKPAPIDKTAKTIRVIPSGKCVTSTYSRLT